MLIRSMAVFLTSGLLVGGCAGKPVTGSQSAHKLTATTQRSIDYRYLMYVPQEYGADRGKRWPLVVFLHGSGERGTDVNKVAANGPPMQAAAGRQFPFVLVSPQCPAGVWWDVDTLQIMLDKILAREGNRIDRDRIYLTGLSMGGGGAWEWLSRTGNPFAAAAIVCGSARKFPLRIKDPVPVWAFHGDADDVVKPWITMTMIDLYQQAGGETRMSIYPGVNHGSWQRAYEEPELWDWMLSHKKQPATSDPEKLLVPRSPATQPFTVN